jgi:Tfp pilus assembly protein PilF
MDAREGRMKISMIVVMIGAMLAGCAGSSAKPSSGPTLQPPAGATPQAAVAMEEGNKLFASGDWQAAKGRYEAAIAAQSSMAEAHYNLALTLDKLNEQDVADKHYVEAANLAPGNRVIWNSRKFRRHAVPDSPFKQQKDKSFLDAKPY